ncbi:MAG TPA: hypothetical protein VFV58_15895 [Blastocatellia bacterium]|jgi:hypothetical protein|nr:hypothetical protein [Blastocatellia bacterium]
MNIKAIKTTGLSFALATAFLVVAGAAGSSSAFAQGLRGLDRDHDGRIDTRWELIQERKGFNDGLAKGRADAIAHRGFKPFPLRRVVSNDYRQGFHKGYAQAYRQFAFNRGHHFGRG